MSNTRNLDYGTILHETVDNIIDSFKNYLGIQFLHNSQNTPGNKDIPLDSFSWLKEKLRTYELLIVRPEDLLTALGQDDWVIVMTPEDLTDAEGKIDKIGELTHGQVEGVEQDLEGNYILGLSRRWDGLLHLKTDFPITIRPFRSIVLKVIGVKKETADGRDIQEQ